MMNTAKRKRAVIVASAVIVIASSIMGVIFVATTVFEAGIRDVAWDGWLLLASVVVAGSIAGYASCRVVLDKEIEQ